MAADPAIAHSDADTTVIRSPAAGILQTAERDAARHGGRLLRLRPEIAHRAPLQPFRRLLTHPDARGHNERRHPPRIRPHVRLRGFRVLAPAAADCTARRGDAVHCPSCG